MLTESQPSSVCPRSAEGICSNSLGVDPDGHRGSVERDKKSRAKLTGSHAQHQQDLVLCVKCKWSPETLSVHMHKSCKSSRICYSLASSVCLQGS
jgi:hypothetical protein